MIRTFQAVVLVFFACGALAQTKTTQALDEKTEGLTLYFYKNTLRMLNQTESKEFDEMIKDIEKMKFVMIDREAEKFGNEEYRKLVNDYKAEKYDELLSSRLESKNIDVYLKEEDGIVKGTIILASDLTSLYVLDILGRIRPDKVGELFKTINESTDIGGMIKEFVGEDKNPDRDNRN